MRIENQESSWNFDDTFEKTIENLSESKTKPAIRRDLKRFLTRLPTGTYLVDGGSFKGYIKEKVEYVTTKNRITLLFNLEQVSNLVNLIGSFTDSHFKLNKVNFTITPGKEIVTDLAGVAISYFKAENDLYLKSYEFKKAFEDKFDCKLSDPKFSFNQLSFLSGQPRRHEPPS